MINVTIIIQNSDIPTVLKNYSGESKVGICNLTNETYDGNMDVKTFADELKKVLPKILYVNPFKNQ